MAIDFDGTEDYINCGSSASLDNIRSLSVCCWAYADSFAADNKRLVGKGTPSSAAGTSAGWELYIGTDAGSSTILRFIQSFTTTFGWWTTTNKAIPVSRWTHLAVTYAGSSTVDPIFYVNGVSEAVTEGQAPTGNIGDDSASDMLVGTHLPLTYYFDGRMEDVRVFNRILSAAEVATLAAGYRGPLGGEVLWLPMQEVDGATLSSAAAVVFDMSGNGNHGTPHGGCLGAASIAPRMSGWIPQ